MIFHCRKSPPRVLKVNAGQQWRCKGEKRSEKCRWQSWIKKNSKIFPLSALSTGVHLRKVQWYYMFLANLSSQTSAGFHSFNNGLKINWQNPQHSVLCRSFRPLYLWIKSTLDYSTPDNLHPWPAFGNSTGSNVLYVARRNVIMWRPGWWMGEFTSYH